MIKTVKKRVVLFLTMLLMLALVLTSCCMETSDAGGTNPFDDRFEEHYAGNGLRVFVDKQTGVCYLWRGIGNKGGLTVMVQPGGQPETYWEGKYAE